MFQRESEPEPEAPKKPQQPKPVTQKSQSFTPKPPVASGGPSGLNLIELQRRIADTKNRLLQTNNASRTTPGGPYRVNDLKPPAIPLDESGQIDLKAMMDKGIIPRRETPNSLAKQKKAVKKTLPISEVPSDYSNPSKNPYFDPSMEVKVAPVERRSRQLKFVQPGKFIAIAEKERGRIQLDKLKQEITESVKRAGMQTEFDVSDKAIKRDAPPAVEWWDAPFTANKTYDDLDEIYPEKYDNLVTMYVHHPVPTRPPSEVNAVPVIKSVMLTTKERKKLRRQKRAEEQKDKRDKIRLGLIEPDLPKVKISNLMRVLGEEAIQDPTKVEARVRREMQQRQKLHEKANEQRKLTPEERRAKISNKIKEDQRISNEIAVFK
ncbi:pre-mRNA processing factor 3-domain-containing protein [Sporodiniella umbellata]|nr:pre-mRNA processing factor 3-domain-containing protein [Sporodiniella umbellata]